MCVCEREFINNPNAAAIAAVSLLVVIIVTSVYVCMCMQGLGYIDSCKFYALLIENNA